MKPPRIVDNWRTILRSWSFQALAVLAALPTMEAQLPQDFANYLDKHFHIVVSVIAIVGVVLRFMKQFDPPSLTAAFEPATQEQTMSVVTTLSEIIAEAPDFIKIVQDGVTVVQAIEAKNFGAVVSGFPGYEADVVKIYNDIKALGVSQAVASGAVTAVAS